MVADFSGYFAHGHPALYYIIPPPDIMVELVALATSALMVVGIALIAPIFHSIKRSEEALREINLAP